jgi:hypothetical protein
LILFSRAGKVPGAAAQHHRADEQAVLVDQAQLHQAGGEAGSTDGEVLSRLSLELEL